jgi:hypothetical protein
MSEEGPIRQDAPSAKCHALKEELLNKKKNPLDIDDDCPICERRGVLCEVANHPSAARGNYSLRSIVSNYIY